MKRIDLGGVLNSFWTAFPLIMLVVFTLLAFVCLILSIVEIINGNSHGWTAIGFTLFFELFFVLVYYLDSKDC